MNGEDNTDFLDFDDVLDSAYFTESDDLGDLEEDESNYEVRPSHYRSIAEL